MIDTMNHGRASQALLIYKTAMRRFVGRTLRSENGGAGDWFTDMVLAKLPLEMRNSIERNVAAAEADDFALQDRASDEGPQRFLEEKHFPLIVKENWEAFGHSLKDRAAILGALRQIKKFRDQKIAHNGQMLMDDEVHEFIELCESVVRLFDTSASAQISQLTTLPEPGSESKSESAAPSDEGFDRSASESVADSESDSSVWEGVRKFERERERRLARIEDLLVRIVEINRAKEKLWEVDTEIESLNGQFGLELGLNTRQIEDAWSYLYQLQWEEAVPALVSEALRDLELSDWNDTQDYSGEMEADFEFSDCRIAIRLSFEIS